MGIFSDMIRGIITEELKAMAAEDAAAAGADGAAGNAGTDGSDGAAGNAGADTGNSDDGKNTKDTASDGKCGDEQNDDNMRDMLRKELRAFMAESMNGESVEGETPTADDALRSILGFAEKE